MKEKTEMTMTTDAETVVRRAYHLAEGNVMDVQGFIDLFVYGGGNCRTPRRRRCAQRRPATRCAVALRPW